MSPEHTYDYAILRLVPRVERGECINLGVILACADVEFLEARIVIDRARMLALDPSVDVDEIERAMDTIKAVCKGGPGSGPIGELTWRERFRWLVSPRSTIIQVSEVHTGRTTDPAATIERLVDLMVRTAPPAR